MSEECPVCGICLSYPMASFESWGRGSRHNAFTFHETCFDAVCTSGLRKVIKMEFRRKFEAEKRRKR